MEIVWLVITVTVVAAASLGAWRMAGRDYRALAIHLAVLLGSAGVCYLISATKTSGFLAGIIGLLSTILLLIAAGGVVLGAGGCWLYQRLSGIAPQQRALAPRWDILGVAAFGVLAIILSAAE